MANNSIMANGTLTKILCAVGFTLFSFFYLHYMQYGLLSMQQHILSGGTTHYDRNVGTAILMCVLWVLNLFVARLTRFKGNVHALIYVPSLCCLLMLTSVQVSTNNKVTASVVWNVIAVSVCILLSIFAVYVRNRKRYTNDMAWRAFPMRILWRNLSILLISIIIVCIGGNTDKALHYRLYIESLLLNEKYEEAAGYSRHLNIDDKNITMLRAYALSKCKIMGDYLFEGSVYGKSEALLPDGKTIKTLIMPDSEIFKMLGNRKKGHNPTMKYLKYLKDNGVAFKSVNEYILCGYLLDKNLDGFVKELQYRYNIQSSSLPKHYKEALILYTHLRAKPEFVYHNEVLDADYADMQKLATDKNKTGLKESYVRDSFGNTYWYYYFYK
ncbi:MAG: DUF6057 family protein [Prevotella sp.]